MLADIRNYLMARNSVTLADLALHFDKEPEVMRGMLGHWVRKGRVARSDLAAACSRSCSGCCNQACNQAAREMYTWKQ